ncbi:MAG: nickel-dependent lactate racemase [Fuerstiella sp.]
MAIELRYGRGVRTLQLPATARPTIIRKPRMPVIADIPAAVGGALDNCVGGSSLHALAQQAASACIAVCDITRPVPNHLFLRPIVERLVDAGIPLDRITVLVATGLHRPNEGDELAELIGDSWVLKNVRIENHFAENDLQHVALGRTQTRDTEVLLDRRFVEADLKIVSGLVEPHFMAGYSGGRKVIAPGLAHVRTIRTFHNSDFMGNPFARSCNFDRNPLHEEQLEIVRMLGSTFAVNTVIDEERRLSFINFGEVVASHHQAVEFVRPFCEVSVPEPYPVVVTSSAGYPLDQTYYQTVKGMVCAMDILADGGELIIVSECAEGLGSGSFRDAQRRLVTAGPEAFLRQIALKPLADIDEWQSQMQTRPMAVGRITLVTDGLKPDECDLTGVNVTDDLNQAVASALTRQQSSKLAVIPEGPYVVPFCRQVASAGG